MHLVTPMYNLIECSSNYSETAGSLWFYSKDEATNFNNKIENTDFLNLSSVRLNYWETQKFRPIQMMLKIEKCNNWCPIEIFE